MLLKACIVDIRKEDCYYASCTRHPVFDVEGGKKALYRKQHAEDGILDVCSKRCSHDYCTREPSFNVEGDKRPAYGRQHAEDGMGNVRGMRCAHDSCMKPSSFTVEGSKTPTYCMPHAEDGMVKAGTKRSSKDSGTVKPGQAVTYNVETTASARLDADVSKKWVNNVGKRSRWAHAGSGLLIPSVTASWQQRWFNLRG